MFLEIDELLVTVGEVQQDGAPWEPSVYLHDKETDEEILSLKASNVDALIELLKEAKNKSIAEFLKEDS